MTPLMRRFRVVWWSHAASKSLDISRMYRLYTPRWLFIVGAGRFELYPM